MNLSIVLPIRNRAQLTSLLSELYDPASPNYRHFLTVDQFTEQFGPTAEDYEKVAAFARANGFTVNGTAKNRLVVSVAGTVDQVQKTFNVTMRKYRHPIENRDFFAPDRAPSVPLDVAISHISGLNSFSVPRPLLTRRSAAAATRSGPADVWAMSGSGPEGLFLGSDMRAAYYGGTELTGKGQIVGLLEFEGYSRSDVDLTFSSSGQFNSVPIANVLVDDATGAACQYYSPCDDTEQVVDIVQAIGMAPGLSQVRVYIGSIDVDILNAIATENLAKEVSISWGWMPDDPATADPIFQEFAAQGQSVFVASGDYGSYIPGDYVYPAESAYVTAVGGTDLVTAGPLGAWSSETAWNRSGGGISPDAMAIPAWQADIANATSGASTTLRNVPDVAAEAETDSYYCHEGSCAGAVGGTSLAAPRWAAFLALVNEQGQNAGDPPVGFLNPALYSLAAGANGTTDLHDIVSGSNDYSGTCGGQPYCQALPGYDLVTGWGSPAGQALIDALAPPATKGFTLASSVNVLTIRPGSSASTTITVMGEGGFAGEVNLSLTGLPAGISASWSANPATANSQLTFTVSATAQRGSYSVTITGASGSLTASTVLTLGVDAPGLVLSAAPADLMVQEGSSVSTTITTSYLDGFSGDVSLAITTPLPAGITATWMQDPDSHSAVLTFSVAPSVPAGTVMLTITGISGGLSATTTVSLAIWEPWVTLSISPTFIPVTQGETVTTTLTAVPSGIPHGAFNLAANALPSGVRVSFDPPSISAGETSQVTITTDGTTPVGLDSFALAAYPVSSRDSQSGTGVGIIVSATPQPSSDITISPGYAILPQGGSTTINITVNTRNGFTGSEYLRVVPPSGVTASISRSPTSDSSVLTLTASAIAPPGLWNMGLCHGTSSINCIPGGHGGYIEDLWVLVQPAATFSLVPAASRISLAPGSSATDTVHVIPQPGFTGNVQLLLVSNLPQGVAASIDQDPSAGSGNLTLSAGSAAPPGIYYLEIVGSSGAQIVAITVQVSLEAPTTTNLTITPTTTGQKSAYILAATVLNASGQPVHGQVDFCDADSPDCTGQRLLGTVELTSGGIAMLRFHPSPGIHRYQAVFPGTPNSATPYAASSSLAQSVTAQGTTTTTLAATGSQGDYTLTASVTGLGPVAPSGTVSFTDSTGGNVTPASAVLGDGTEHLSFTSLTQASGFSTPVAIAAADFNEDGIPDLAVANRDANTVTVLIGSGDGAFSPLANPLPTGLRPDAIAAGDFNGDGNLDLAVANSGSRSLTILLGHGDGTFTAAPMIPSTGSYPASLVVADFNGDGNLDLAVANESSSSITILLGNGDGSFTPANSPASGQCPYAITSGDFNGDRIPDLAVANACDNSVTTLLGNGDGTFSSPSAIPVGTQPFGIAAGDFNGNGKTDLAVASIGDGTVTVLPGNGDGTFNAEPSISLPHPYAVAVADLNADGIPDLAVATATSIEVLLGNGDATFHATPLSLPNGGVALAIGDWNQDGFPDLVAVGGGTSLNAQLASWTATATATATGVSVSGVGAQTILATFAGDSNYLSSSSAGTSLSPGPQAATPAFSVPAGTYTSVQTVAISDSTPGAAIYYTTNGSTPTTSSTPYSGPITVSSSETIQAIATAIGYSPSAVASAAYTINLPAATPTFSVTPGTYTSVQTVAISDSTPGATIYYTTNGSTPTTSSTPYSGPITVSSSETIEAIGIADGYSPSAVASATYTINLPANAAPELSSLSPAYVSAGATGFTLTLNGSGFVNGSVVYWGTSALTTLYVSATQLTAFVPSEDIATAGAIKITVQTPSSGTAASNSLQFEVDSAQAASNAPSYSVATATVVAGNPATYTVALPSGASSVTLQCLNIPSGASCSYSASAKTVTIATGATTPKGTYQITTVFTETVSSPSAAYVVLPFLLLPLYWARKRLTRTTLWTLAWLTVFGVATALTMTGCGGAAAPVATSPVTPPTQVTSSGVVSLTVQ